MNVQVDRGVWKAYVRSQDRTCDVCHQPRIGKHIYDIVDVPPYGTAVVCNFCSGKDVDAILNPPPVQAPTKLVEPPVKEVRYTLDAKAHEIFMEYQYRKETAERRRIGHWAGRKS